MNTKLPIARRPGLLLAALPLVLLAGCATNPTGPSVAVMPAPNKPFEVFVEEDNYCRAYAQQAIGGTNAADAGNERAVGTAVVGTVVGAAVGTALGGQRHGTAVGAGTGLLVGSTVGAEQGAMSSRGLQRRYDIAYMQCMYAKGNQVPGYAMPRNVPPPPPPTR